MATLYTHQTENIRKTWLLFSLFLIVVIGLGWLLSYVFQNQAILYVAVALSLLMNITSYWYADKIALALARAAPADPAAYRELYRVVENLAITAGLPAPRVYIITDPAPNAFATGRDKEHAAIAVTTGLLQILNQTELEGVIAHELSHVGNRDILLSTVVVVLAGVVSLLADFFLRSLWWGRGRNKNDRGGGLMLIGGIAAAILAPLAATLVQLAISRKREFLADASGALLTRYPEGLASALEKIGAYSRPLAHPSSATAHLFISNPFGPPAGGPAAGWFSKLFMTHPPLAERVRLLRDMAK